MRFYPSESFYGQQQPSRFEADVYDCEVIGAIPPSIEGSLFRSGPDRQYPTMEGDVLINGDGMISAFHFENGHVDFRSRYVRTARFLAERKARRRLYGKYRNPVTDEPDAPPHDRDNTGNTTAFFHAGKLFALREDSRPHRIDPETLETGPIHDFDGALQSLCLSAHPKIDPVSGEWWSFGLFNRRQFDGDMALMVADRTGKLVREEEFHSPYPGLAHDFAVTQDHVVFAVMPLTVDAARVAAGGDFYAYDPALAPAWGVMRRDASTASIRWFSVPEGFSGHILNAYSEGDTVHVDATISPGSAFRFFRDVNGHSVDPRLGIPTITRLSFDLATPSNDPVSRTPFPGAHGELPRADDRFQTLPYRYGFFKTQTGVARLDWRTMQLAEHRLDDIGGSAQEPIFVPRSPDAPEGDGHVLTLVTFPRENRCALYILDAMDMAGPPVARVLLPFNLYSAFHGWFVPAADLDPVSG